MNYYLVTFCIKYSRRLYKDYEVELLSNDEKRYMREITRQYFIAQEVRLISMCVIRDHIHMLFHSYNVNLLKRRIGKFKGFSSVMINRKFRESYKDKGKQNTLWAQRFHIQFINSKSHLHNTIEYIRTNEEHHASQSTQGLQPVLIRTYRPC